MSLAKSSFPDEENVSPVLSQLDPAYSETLRRTSYASTDSRMSEGSSRLGRRFSSLANQVIQNERDRRASRSLYQSPYSKMKMLSENGLTATVTKPTIIPLENTYRMEPKRHFPVDQIRQIIIKTLENGIGNQNYSQINPGRVCKTLSQLIKDQVKSLEVEQFRVICVVTIGTKSAQGVRIASRCLWDEQFDRYASATVDNGSLFSVGTVYGVYFE